MPGPRHWTSTTGKPPADLDADAATFSAASVAAGGNAWGHADLEPPALSRLYRATVDVAYVLGNGGREQVPLD